MLKSSLCDYSHAYIRVTGTIKVKNTAATNNDNGNITSNNNGIQVVLKNCTPFTNCISEITNIQIDNAKDIDVVIPMYILMEYNDPYSKTSASLWQY